LDRSNPLVAARLARTLEQAVHWCDPHRGTALAAVAEVARDARSNEVQEVAARIREMHPL
jgi:ABC-type nitrate/sulfonate/bicarbonate transport system substrate-binding protein